MATIGFDRNITVHDEDVDRLLKVLEKQAKQLKIKSELAADSVLQKNRRILLAT